MAYSKVGSLHLHVVCLDTSDIPIKAVFLSYVSNKHTVSVTYVQQNFDYGIETCAPVLQLKVGLSASHHADISKLKLHHFELMWRSTLEGLRNSLENC